MESNQISTETLKRRWIALKKVEHVAARTISVHPFGEPGRADVSYVPRKQKRGEGGYNASNAGKIKRYQGVREQTQGGSGDGSGDGSTVR